MSRTARHPTRPRAVGSTWNWPKRGLSPSVEVGKDWPRSSPTPIKMSALVVQVVHRAGLAKKSRPDSGPIGVVKG